MAARMMKEGGDNNASRLTFGFELVTARLPSAEERQILQRLYQQRLEQFQQDPAAAQAMLSVGDSPRDNDLDMAEHAAWTVIARLLLNLDETINKG